MTLTSILWRLQAIDQELDDKTKRARQIDEALANDPVVASARADVDTEQKNLTTTTSSLRARESEAASLDAKIKELEKRLYSGLVGTPKELDGLGKDLEMHKRIRGQMDDEILRLMESVDQIHARVRGKTETLKQSESARAGEVERLGLEAKAVAARLERLKIERDEARQTIGPEALRQYDHLRKTRGGRAVAQLRSSCCGACGVEVPSGLAHRLGSGDEIVLCSGCGRILVK